MALQPPARYTPNALETLPLIFWICDGAVPWEARPHMIFDMPDTKAALPAAGWKRVTLATVERRCNPWSDRLVIVGH